MKNGLTAVVGWHAGLLIPQGMFLLSKSLAPPLSTGGDMRDKVWFTYKARIQAHHRLAKNDFHSQVLLVWYAAVSSLLAIATVRYPKALGDDTDILSACLSVVLLVVSMLVTNRDFRGRSIEMRQNYLALQELYDRTAPASSMTPADVSRYHELLQSVENHTELDDRYFRVFHKGTLSRAPGRIDYAQVYAYLLVRFLVLTALYVAPVVMLLPLARAW